MKLFPVSRQQIVVVPFLESSSQTYAIFVCEVRNLLRKRGRLGRRAKVGGRLVDMSTVHTAVRASMGVVECAYCGFIYEFFVLKILSANVVVTFNMK